MSDSAHLFICLLLVSCQVFFGSAALQAPKIDIGIQNFIPDVSVYGGVIVSDRKSIASKHFNHIEHTEAEIGEVHQILTKNIDQLSLIFPFELLKWPVINTKPCPAYAHTHHRIEHGQGMSHLQIWLEFVFFDNDVLDARVRAKPEYITSNDYSSVSGIFTSVENGSLYKNKIPFLDTDIMVVLEDSAVLISSTVNSTGFEPTTITANNKTTGTDNTPSDNTSQVQSLSLLKHLLSRMDTDIMSLGLLSTQRRLLNEQSPHAPHAVLHNTHSVKTVHNNIHATAAHTTPMAHSAHINTAHTVTSYAYAITRAGARKLIACYDHCGMLIVEQMANCIEAELVSHKHATHALFEQNV